MVQTFSPRFIKQRSTALEIQELKEENSYSHEELKVCVKFVLSIMLGLGFGLGLGLGLRLGLVLVLGLGWG